MNKSQLHCILIFLCGMPNNFQGTCNFTHFGPNIWPCDWYLKCIFNPTFWGYRYIYSYSCRLRLWSVSTCSRATYRIVNKPFSCKFNERYTYVNNKIYTTAFALNILIEWMKFLTINRLINMKSLIIEMWTCYRAATSNKHQRNTVTVCFKNIQGIGNLEISKYEQNNTPFLTMNTQHADLQRTTFAPNPQNKTGITLIIAKL